MWLWSATKKSKKTPLKVERKSEEFEKCFLLAAEAKKVGLPKGQIVRPWNGQVTGTSKNDVSK